MSEDKKESFMVALQELGQIMDEITQEYDVDCEKYWLNLSNEDQLKSFYSVVKRICKAELEDRGSYRHALYQVFGFGEEAYIIGMDCGFMELHNSIYVGDEIEKIVEGKIAQQTAKQVDPKQ
jgi:hypothetical protein